MISKESPVVIIGAGISGLTTAYFLLRKQIPVEIWEASDRVGGLIRTQKSELLRTEFAANGFLATKLLEELASEIGVELQAASQVSRRRFIYWGKPRQWPLSLLQSLGLLPLVLRLIFAKESLRPRTGESVAQWATRVAGPYLNTQLLQPALQGIYAGDTERLSAELLLTPLLFPKPGEKTVRGALRGTVAPRAGMQEFTDKLADYLQKKGVSISLNKKAELATLSGRTVVFAVNAQAAAGFLSQLAPGETLRPEMLPVLRSSFAWRKPAKTLQGFGVLMAAKQGFRTLGVLSDSEVYPGSSLAHQESWIFGGARDPQAALLSEAELVQIVHKERLKLLADATLADAHQIVRWPEALPHYSVDWCAQLKTWESRRRQLEAQNLYFVGNYLGSLGLSRILAQNQRTAERIATHVSSARKSI